MVKLIKRNLRKKKKLNMNLILYGVGCVAMTIYSAILIAYLFMYGMAFMGQWHNIDLTHNVCMLGNDINQELFDSGNYDLKDTIYLTNFRNVGDQYEIGKSMGMTEMYIESMDNIRTIYIITPLVSALLVLCILGGIWSFQLFMLEVIKEAEKEKENEKKPDTKKAGLKLH